MDVEVIAGRVYLIPPKGLLAEYRGEIERKFNGGEFRWVTDNFEIPSRKFGFEVEVVVDDDCEICPAAIELVSEMAAKFSNVTAKIYNATYVQPPFEVAATPSFRINKVVKFAGMPLDPESVGKYFAEFLKEAYVRSHPRTGELIERIRRFAELHGLRRNPNDSAYMNILYRLLRNIDEHGKPYCPCRPVRREDTVCPCPHSLTEVKTKGTCLCGLFWSKEKVDEYIKERIKRYGWAISEIEKVQKALEELKKRVVTGRSRILAESIINKLHEIYAVLPED